MKVYKLKKLPVNAEDTLKRIENLEAIINQLGIQFAEEEDGALKLADDVKELFEEVDPQTLLK